MHTIVFLIKLLKQTKGYGA